MEIKRSVVMEVVRLAKEYYGEQKIGDKPEFVSADKIDIEEVQKDPKRRQLFDYVDGLSENEKAELVALVWVGRGDYSPEEWDRLVELAQAQVLERGSAAGYLTDKRQIGDFLERGLRELESNG